jgi:hypothetical protein
MPYDGGEALALVRDDRMRAAEKKPLVRIVTLFPQLFDAMPVFDHKAAFVGYAQDYGLTVAEEGHAVRVADGDDYVLATFDSLGRLTQLEGTVNPEKPKPAKKPTAKAKPKAAVKKLAKKRATTKAAANTTAARKLAAKKPATKGAQKAAARKATKATGKKPAGKKPAGKRPTRRG